MNNQIKSIKAREILSSGSSPTVEAEVVLSCGLVGRASAPFGASAGSHEAYILLDQDKKRYQGKGVLKAINNIEKKIAVKLKGVPVNHQEKIDQIMLELDGTGNKQKLGSNAILAVSLACARTAALFENIPLYQYINNIYKFTSKKHKLPHPMMVVIEGGEHADDSTDWQEYLIVPQAKTVRESIQWGIEVYQALKSVLKSQKLNVNVGNEGAFAPAGIKNNEIPLKLILEAIKKAGFKVDQEIGLALDLAATEFYKNKQYWLKRERRKLSAQQLISYLEKLMAKYSLMSLEDALAEDDWKHWATLNHKFGKKVKIVGDDLTATNPRRLQKAIQERTINTVVIKPNQIGTLTETAKAIKLAQANNIETIVSHRGGGETNDTFIVDLAVAAGSWALKVGPSRGERVGKYNRLMEIEEELLGSK